MKQGDLIAGRYRLVRPVGAGAMGTVWSARHELLGRDFALKLATITDRAGPDARGRFLREAQIVGKLRHPNVVDVADVGEVAPGGGLYLAMELLQGQSLADRIRRHAPVAPSEALAITGEICRGLAAAHAAGVVHRDIKPENIFLARGAAGGVVPKLLDFGVSSARGIITLTSGQIVGTPAYMSPELAMGEAGFDHRADVWSLGVVLYEMLTGQLPFEADNYPALLPLIIEKPYPPLPAEIPAEVRTVVAGCLAKDRADRYPSADALREAVERARGAIRARREDPLAPSGFFVETGHALRSMPPQAGGAPARMPRRRLVLLLLAVPIAIGLAAVAIAARRSAAPPRAPVPPTATAVATAVAMTPTAAPRSQDVLPPPEPSPATTVAPAPTATETGRSRPPDRPGPPPGRPVTRVNSAGF